MEKISDILLAEVEDENGRKYGRVFELRSDGDPEHGSTSKTRAISSLLCGSSGWLQELGFRPSKISTIQWDEIVEIKKKKVIIRPPSADRE
jgi:sporulation protein YlmC with PRC-barrel domain